jgi:hypothetical protein
MGDCSLVGLAVASLSLCSLGLDDHSLVGLALTTESKPGGASQRPRDFGAICTQILGLL